MIGLSLGVGFWAGLIFISTFRMPSLVLETNLVLLVGLVDRALDVVRRIRSVMSDWI